MPSHSSIKHIGLQLHTVRNEMREDIAGTITKVAAIGYKEIEFAGYFGTKPSEIRKLTDDLNLTVVGSHVDVKEFGDSLDKVLEDALTIGAAYVVIPALAHGEHESIDDFKRWAHRFNLIGDRCRTSGLRFGYHNHDFEFVPVGGILPYEILLNETDPRLVTMEMDLYWMEMAGQEICSYFRKFPSRFPLLHVKDMGKDRHSTEIGSGVIDFQTIFSDKSSGARHYIVEQEHFQRSPLESTGISFRYLAGLNF